MVLVLVVFLNDLTGGLFGSWFKRGSSWLVFQLEYEIGFDILGAVACLCCVFFGGLNFIPCAVVIALLAFFMAWLMTYIDGRHTDNEIH